jgi:hypothetical protein
MNLAYSRHEEPADILARHQNDAEDEQLADTDAMGEWIASETFQTTVNKEEMRLRQMDGWDALLTHELLYLMVTGDKKQKESAGYVMQERYLGAKVMRMCERAKAFAEAEKDEQEHPWY